MSELFPKLVPPPGGLSRLQERLAEASRPRRWGLVLWLSPIAAAAAAAAWLLVTPPPQPLSAEQALALEIASGVATGEPVSTVPGDAQPPLLQRLPSGDPKLILYAVAPTADLEAR